VSDRRETRLKVRTLYILNAGMLGGLIDDDESSDVSRGLFLKYKDRCSAVGVVLLKNEKLLLEPLLLKGPLPLNGGVAGRDQVNPQQADALVEGLPADPAGVNRSVGAYVVMHGPAGFAVPADDLARLLDEMLPAAAKPKLHYVVLLACNIALENPGEVALDAEDALYVTRFMKEMLARGMKPVTAGWDVFITAAPHRPTETHENKQVPRSVRDHQTGKKIADLESIPGKKIIKSAPAGYSTVPNEYRKLHKRVFQVANGKLSVKLGTWSTRLG
jgi:hypothetical protein